MLQQSHAGMVTHACLHTQTRSLTYKVTQTHVHTVTHAHLQACTQALVQSGTVTHTHIQCPRKRERLCTTVWRAVGRAGPPGLLRGGALLWPLRAQQPCHGQHALDSLFCAWRGRTFPAETPAKGAKVSTQSMANSLKPTNGLPLTSLRLGLFSVCKLYKLVKTSMYF